MPHSKFFYVVVATVAATLACVQLPASFSSGGGALDLNDQVAGGTPGGDANADSNASIVSSAPRTGLSIALPPSAARFQGAFSLQLPQEFISPTTPIVSNVFDVKWALRADPNHYTSVYISIPYDSRSPSRLVSASSKGRWSLIAETPSSNDRVWLQTSPGEPPNGTTVTYAFEAGAWAFSVDNGQPDGDQTTAMRSAPVVGGIDAEEMTFSVHWQIRGVVPTLEVTDFILATGEGPIDTCPAVKTASDVVMTDDFQLSDDKKTCRLSRIKFLVGGS